MSSLQILAVGNRTGDAFSDAGDSGTASPPDRDCATFQSSGRSHLLHIVGDLEQI
jgi:hypothetical protein